MSTLLDMASKYAECIVSDDLDGTVYLSTLIEQLDPPDALIVVNYAALWTDYHDYANKQGMYHDAA